MRRLIILDHPQDINLDSQSKTLLELDFDDLFVEVNFRLGMKDIILCKDGEFKFIKKYGKTPKTAKVYEIAYLKKVVTSL